MHVTRFPIDLQLWLVFLAIAETGSATAAARKLNLSQSAISHALGRLRLALSDALFVRHRGHLVPTDRGASLIGPVTRLLQDAAALQHPAGFDPATTKRTFRIALCDYASLALTQVLARGLSRLAPGARLVVDPATGGAAERLTAGQLDAVVWSTTRVAAPLKATTILRDELAVVADRAHPLLSCGTAGSRLSLDDYRQFKHVKPRVSADVDDVIEARLEQEGLRRDIAFVTESYRSAIDILEGTALLLTLPSRVLSRMPHDGAVRLPAPFAAKEITYDVVWNGRREEDAGMTWLVDLVTRVASGERAPGDDGPARRRRAPGRRAEPESVAAPC